MIRHKTINNISWFTRIISGVVLLSLILSPFFFIILINIDSGLSQTTYSPIDSASLSSDNTSIINDDWIIEDGQEINVFNKTLILKGNIIIEPNGKLSLFNITLVFKNSLSNYFNITVKSNGSLHITDSLMSSTTNPACSKIDFKNRSIGSITNTQITQLGVNAWDKSGVIIQSDYVSLENCTITNSTTGLILDNCSALISNVSIYNCKMGISGINSKSKIINSLIKDCVFGIKLRGKSNITAIDSILAIYSSELNDESRLLIQNSLNIKIMFITPQPKPIKNADLMVVNNFLTIYSTIGFDGNNNRTDKDGKIKTLIIDEKLFSGKNITNYTTILSVKYKSRNKLNNRINTSPTHSEIITFENELPILNFPTVTPECGTQESDYFYKVKYSDIDNDPPIKMDIDIDGTQYPMQNIYDTNDWTNGTWFRFNTSLDFGKHEFRFITNDGFGFEDVYAPEDGVTYFSGPVVEIPNSVPILLDGSVNPKEGNQDTTFRYSIRYFDVDGDEPALAKVYIDNLPHTMIQVEKNKPTDDDGAGQGIWFEFQTRLLVGDHDFYFKFKDHNGSSIVRWPEDKDDTKIVVEGPVVYSFQNSIPTVGNGSVSPSIGHRLIRFSYTISFFDADCDLPTIAMVIIDSKPYNLTRARIAQDIYFYETYLPLGEHYFHFIFGDEINDHYVRYPSDTGLELYGPIVIDIPPLLETGQVTPKSGGQNTNFNFSIIYRDPEADPPKNSSVIIDNQSYILVKTPLDQKSVDAEKSNSSSDNNILLSYSTQLGIGGHSFYFLIQSGNYLLKYPSSGYLSGPVVEPEPEMNPNQTSNITPDNQKNTTSNEENNTDCDPESIPTEYNDGTLPENYIILTVINYSVTKLKDSLGTNYLFIVYCQIPKEFSKNSQCWLYINGESFLMNAKHNYEKNDSHFVLYIYLSPGEHYYHFLFKVGDTMIRYPYKGEFQGPNVEADPGVGDQQMSERNLLSENVENIQIIAIVSLSLAFIIFSIYYSYYIPKKKLK